MKRMVSLLVGLLFSVQTVAATFAPHQILTATDLNNALANAAITSGTISGATITTSPISGSTGAFTTLASPSVSLTGGLIDGVSLGTVTPAAGAFTTLSASGAVSGTGFSTYLASPPAIGGTVAAAGSFSNLSSSGTVSGTGFSTYLASPPAIGGTAPAAGAFTTLSASSTVSGTGFSTYLASPPAIGGTAAAAGAFTTLSASSTVSGTGFSTYLASPPAIGGTAPAAGSFTTVTSTVATGTPPLTVTSTTPVTNLSIGGNAATATTATNLSGGAGGSVPYQSAAGTTAMLANGTAGQVLQSNGGTAAPSWGFYTDKIQPITASVAANALTVNLNPTTLDFRSTTLGSGAVTTINVPSQLSLVVPSSATLGCINAVLCRLVEVAIDNAGTIELAIVNQSGGNDLSETGVISTTAISAAATSASTFYSTSARTNVAYRVVGYVEATEATAGTWATAPSLIQGYGGQAAATMMSLGYGQTWQGFTSGNRPLGTTFYNTTSKPIIVNALMTINAANAVAQAVVNGFTLYGSYTQVANGGATITVVVPPSGSYLITGSGGTPSWAAWGEFR